MNGRVLTIAGSDSGGGAGIQADIKTITALGSYASSAITALTAQNTKGVFGIYDVPDKFIEQQIELVLSDIGADAIKTGMLHREGVIKTIVKALKKYPKIPVVVDPVMVAKGGSSLLEKKAVNALMDVLVPLCTVVTPNIPEAEVLSGIKIKKKADMIEAAARIMMMGAKNVLIKGGHMKGPLISNILVNKDGAKTFEAERIKSKHTHGTGCTLASAIATGLAQGMDLEKSVEVSIAYVGAAIESAPKLGKGNGPINHFLLADF